MKLISMLRTEVEVVDVICCENLLCKLFRVETITYRHANLTRFVSVCVYTFHILFLFLLLLSFSHVCVRTTRHFEQQCNYTHESPNVDDGL